MDPSTTIILQKQKKSSKTSRKRSNIDIMEYMACYPMKKMWSASTATWDNMVPDTTGATCYFNITNLYRSWCQ